MIHVGRIFSYDFCEVNLCYCFHFGSRFFAWPDFCSL
jgi:hypothetical protein